METLKVKYLTMKSDNPRRHSPSKNFELIHGEIHGPMNFSTFSDLNYLIVFTDECSSNKWIYMIKERINALEGFQLFLTHVEEIYGFKVATLKTHMEYEWSTIKFKDLLEKQGIKHQYAASGQEQEDLKMNKLICGKEMCSFQDTSKGQKTKKTTTNVETFSKGGTSLGPTGHAI